jgi:hypothetical protein
MVTKKSKAQKFPVLKCPQCANHGLLPIAYGMPSDDFEFEKFIVGGCMPSKADIGCSNCGWTGIRDEMAYSQFRI